MFKKKTLSWVLVLVLMFTTSFTFAPKMTVFAATATYNGTDTTTQGAWKSAYGAEGYVLCNYASTVTGTNSTVSDVRSLPSYLSSVNYNAGTSYYNWGNTSDTKALEPVSGNRNEACVYSATNNIVTINANDSNSHNIALYLYDPDTNNARACKVEILDMSNNSLCTQQTISTFGTTPVYLKYTVTGSVQIKLTNMTSGGIWSTVLQGIFWGGAVSATPTPMPTPTPTVITVTVNDRTTGTGENQFEYVGNWGVTTGGDCAGCYNSDASWSNTTNDYVQVRFTGTKIRLYGKQAAHHGTGKVSIDGGAESDANFYAPTNVYKVLVYESPDLAYTTHTLKLRVNSGYSVPDYVEIDNPRGTPTTVTVSGSDNVIPTTGNIYVNYSATVLNEYGKVMPGEPAEPATWSLQSPVTGVSVNPSTGVVTVGSNALVGSNFTVVATADSINSTKTVLLISATLTYNLNTDDTNMTISVGGNQIYITSLKNPQQGWDWAAGGISLVPLLSKVSGVPVNWTYAGYSVDTIEGTDDGYSVDTTNGTNDGNSVDTTNGANDGNSKDNGTKLTLIFTSASPKLELKSIWWARPGVGPVETWMTVRNKTNGNISIDQNDMLSADLNVKSDNIVNLWRFAKMQNDVATPVIQNTIGTNANIASTFSNDQVECDLPFQMLDVNSTHGIYFGYEFDFGKFNFTTGSDPLLINYKARLWDSGSLTFGKGSTYTIPSLYIGTYKGDIDDGSNKMKRWFWNYKITPTLRNNTNEPMIEVCESPSFESNVDNLINQINTMNFASWGIGLYKTDYWYKSTGHVRSDELVAAGHANGLKLSFYWDGFISEAALKAEYDKSHFDCYRSDCYIGGHPEGGPLNYFNSINYWQKIDNMFTYAPGFMHENCCNGGTLKSFNICQRMSFVTTVDDSANGQSFRRALYANGYMINPAQLGSMNYNYSIWSCRTSMMGQYSFGFPSDMNAATQAFVKQHTLLYAQKQRPILRGGNMYHILPIQGTESWDGMEFFNTDINKGSVFLFAPNGSQRIIKLKGLNRTETYTLTFQDGTSQNCTKTGEDLMDNGINVTMGVNVSEIIWIN